LAGECSSIAKGEGLWVAGPVRVEVSSGTVLASGFELASGESVIVKDTRGFTFYALEDSRICVVAGHGARWELVREGFQQTVAWQGIVEKVAEKGYSRIAIVGPVESGKSTLTAWLYNATGLCAIESDVGQNELGTPAAVSLAYGGKRVLTLQDLEPDLVFFVGHVSAAKVADLVVAGAVRAARRCQGFVVDTDGFVSGRGLYYKRSLVEALEADLVIAMEPLDPAPFSATSADVIRAPRPPLARERSRVDRRSFRQRAYASMFAPSPPTPLAPSRFVGLCELVELGEELRGKAVAYRCEDGLYLERLGAGYVKAPEGVRVLPHRWWKGLLVGLKLSDGREELAVIERASFHEGVVVVRMRKGSTVEPKSVEAVMLGWVKLNENYEEELLDPGTHPSAIMKGSGRRVRRA
jgi:polynucleotide 5'-hydroxyl-kinase GRC3/NOL9